MPWKNAEARRAYQAKYRADNREALSLARKAWRLGNIDERLQKESAYRARTREGKRVYFRDWKRRFRSSVINHYGGRCACCDEAEIAFLTIDHKNGDGAGHRRRLGMRGGATFYTWLKTNNFPPEYQVLCWNCNLAKGLYGACPHSLVFPHPC